MRALRAALEAKAKQAAPPPPPPTSGWGWSIVEHPRVSHEALEGHTRAIWDFIFHGIDYPDAWRVRWGRLDPMLLTLAGAAEKIVPLDHTAWRLA